MNIKLTIDLKVIDVDKVREVYATTLSIKEKDKAYLTPITRVVESLLLNLDKLPTSLKVEANNNEDLTCFGLSLENSYSKIDIEDEDEYD